MKKISHITYLKVIISLALLGTACFFVWQKNIVIELRTRAVLPVVNTYSSTNGIEHLTVEAGETHIENSFTDGDTLYAILSNAAQNQHIVFVGKESPGLGFLVTQIGSLRQGNGKFLMYYVNGVEAAVGISSYHPHNNDVIVWKLE